MAASKNKSGVWTHCVYLEGKSMNKRAEKRPRIDIETKRQYMALGAYIASVKFRDDIRSSDFVDNDIAKCVEEMEGVINGTINKEDMRYLPFLMESLNCSTDVKPLDGLVSAIKAHRRSVEANKLGKRLQIALPHEIEQLKERAANL